MIEKSIVIGSLARNCSEALRQNMERIEQLGSYFSSYNVVVFENDSIDSTKEILHEWSLSNEHVVCVSEDTNTSTIPEQSDTIPYPAWSIYRIEKMAQYRNRLMDEIGKRFSPDILCIIDIDLYYFSVEGIISAIENAPDNWGGLFANGQNWYTKGDEKTYMFPTQYDSFAFLEKGKNYKLSSSFKFTHDDEIFKGYNLHRIVCNTCGDYVPCESAFNGIGIYPYDIVKDARYTAHVIPEFSDLSIALCEHVPFNCEIAAKGYGMYIAKSMIAVRECWNLETAIGLSDIFKNAIKKNIQDYKIVLNGQSKKKRYSVLTYNFNNYEIVREIGEKDPEAEYILVTDNFLFSSDTWNVIYDPSLEGLSPFDQTFYVRYNCFRYCNTDICLRIDGSIEVKHSLKPLIDVFEEGNYDASLMPHPVRDNFIDEYNTWVKIRGYDRKQADKCIESMREKGYDFNYKGMFQACFSIQRRGRLTDEIDRVTYKYLKELGMDGKIERLDQVPFSFIMNTQFSGIKILPVSEQILRSYYMQWYEHNSIAPNMNMFYDYSKDDERYMFNKKVKCLYLEAPVEKARVREQELQIELKEVWQANKEKDIRLEHAETTLHNSEIHIEALKNTISDQQSHIAALQSNIEQQTQCIGEQQKYIESLQDRVDSISKKNQKHLNQIRILVIILFMTIVGLILSLFL